MSIEKNLNLGVTSELYAKIQIESLMYANIFYWLPPIRMTDIYTIQYCKTSIHNFFQT